MIENVAQIAIRTGDGATEISRVGADAGESNTLYESKLWRSI